MIKIEDLAAEIGFDCMGGCSAKELTVRPEVRAMCSADKCKVYDHSWACPPACGEIEDFEKQMHEFEHCLVVQTVADLEADFDFATMEEAGERQKARMLDLVAAIDKVGLSDETMVLSAGTCTLCTPCSYPDAPCRFPEKRTSSMEALGMLVLEVCKKNDLSYYYGPLKIAYTSCFLLK